MTQPILAVIIVAYRSRDEILACVTSIPGTINHLKVETVVIDNSLNDDGTLTLLEEQAPSVQRVCPLKNLGFGKANNLGFASSSSEYVLFLNPDTVVNEAALQHCLRRLQEDPSIGLISPKLVLPDGSMDLACRRSIPTLWDGFCRASGLAVIFPQSSIFSGYNLTHLPEEGTYDVGAINGAFMMGRRSFLESIAEPAPSAIFDEHFFMYGDDLDLCIRVSKAGKRIVYEGRQSIIHLKGISVAKELASMSAAIFDANRDVYLKHFGKSRLERLQYLLSFGAWKCLARIRSAIHPHNKVRPR